MLLVIFTFLLLRLLNQLRQYLLTDPLVRLDGDQEGFERSSGLCELRRLVERGMGDGEGDDEEAEVALSG
jgi:hypothetical protein